MEFKLFKTTIELNEEAKSSIPIEIDFYHEKYDSNRPADRDKLLLKYGISEPSEDNLDTIINEYIK